MDLAFPKLKLNQQKGSKPRCHLLTHGTTTEVAERLTSLVEPWGKIRPHDRWMPAGFDRCEEAQLHSAAEIIPNEQQRTALREWWLAVASERTTTPNIDLASTCLVQGQEGLLLIEAKAHDFELITEEHGKPLADEASGNTFASHRQIRAAMDLANSSLAQETGLPWALSRDTRYQMSNRFAWSWKLSELGIPIILVYLAFTGCEEMRAGKTRQRS